MFNMFVAFYENTTNIAILLLSLDTCKLLCRYHCLVTQHSLKRLRKSKILECVKQALTTAFFFTNPTKDKNDKTIENTILSKEEEKDAHSCSIPPTWKQFAYMTKCVTKMCNSGFSYSNFFYK